MYNFPLSFTSSTITTVSSFERNITNFHFLFIRISFTIIILGSTFLTVLFTFSTQVVMLQSIHTGPRFVHITPHVMLLDLGSCFTVSNQSINCLEWPTPVLCCIQYNLHFQFMIWYSLPVHINCAYFCFLKSLTIITEEKYTLWSYLCKVLLSCFFAKHFSITTVFDLHWYGCSTEVIFLCFIS